MYEVCLKLRFETPSLGSKRGEKEGDPDQMIRGPDGNVTFSQTWWRTIVCQGAKCYGKHQERVRSILWGSSVDGTTKMFTRYYLLRDSQGRSQKLCKEHEAFLAGEIIGVKAMLPDDIPIEDFKDIMAVAGQYFGISPFGWKMGFGKFTVTEITRAPQMKKEAQNAENGNPVNQGKPVGDISG